MFNIEIQHARVLTYCYKCTHWNFEQNTCGTSINCLNQIVKGFAPSRYTDIIEAKNIRDNKF